MYAVIKAGGKQYRVSPGDEVILEKLPQLEGEKVKFEDLLLVNRDGEVIVGKKLKGIKVKGTVLEQFKGEKIEVFKYKPKKRYRRKHGHRQLLTRVRIDEIEFPEKKKVAKKVKEEKKEKVKAVRKKRETRKEEVKERTEKRGKKRVSKKEEKVGRGEEERKEKREKKKKRVTKASSKKKKESGGKKVEEEGKKR
jgi:large subunit ribosomal protein L21